MMNIPIKQIQDLSRKIEYQKANNMEADFNIFDIVGIKNKEIRHSKFIAELLNPKGRHKEQSRYLELFLKVLNGKNKGAYELYNLDTCYVQDEEYISTITSDKLEGGSIDIFIKDEQGNSIIIENKIYAKDQKHQLLRYHNYAPKAKLIYLTLFENEPSEYSLGNKNEEKEGGKHPSTYINRREIECISYKYHILKWLEQCAEITKNETTKGAIQQYINTIKLLTMSEKQEAFNESSKDLSLDEISSFASLMSNVSLLNVLERAVEMLKETNKISKDIIAKVKWYTVDSEALIQFYHNESDEQWTELYISNGIIKVYYVKKDNLEIELTDPVLSLRNTSTDNGKHFYRPKETSFNLDFNNEALINVLVQLIAYSKKG